ncbi:MAG: gas vesicle protein [Labilithrix sp.]|nr:gas vesicle protein [Labilithrix sp.]
MSTRRRSTRQPPPVLEGLDASLLDVVDHVLNKGIVLTGDLVLGVAQVDLVYLRISAVLCAADRILGPPDGSARRRARLGAPAGRATASVDVRPQPAIGVPADVRSPRRRGRP